MRIFNGNIIGGTTQTSGVFTAADWNDGISSLQPISTTLQVSDLIVRGVWRRGIFGGWATGNRIESLNPNSLYHLALRVNYPNPYDQAKGELDGRDDQY